MPIYENPPVEVREVCDRMMEKYHGPLRDAGVTVDLLFACTDPERDEDVALKLHGYRANAIVKVVSYKLRVQGHADAEIVIDGDEWFAWKPEEKDAILDHELEHLELKVDKEGHVVRDDLDRPKLRLRLHDHEFGWFDSVARRHGKHSFEVQQYERFQEAHRQLWIDFKDEEAEVTISIAAGDKVVKATKGRGKSFKQEVADEFEARGILAKGNIKGTTRRAASKRK